MDKISAKNLIKETFSYPFNEEKFSKFSVNLLEQIKTMHHPLGKIILAYLHLLKKMLRGIKFLDIWNTKMVKK